jgi:hypothetical protein
VARRPSPLAQEDAATRAAQRDTLYTLCDEVAALLDIDPERIMFEPPDRVSLTVTQLRALLALIPQPSQPPQEPLGPN